MVATIFVRRIGSAEYAPGGPRAGPPGNVDIRAANVSVRPGCR